MNQYKWSIYKRRGWWHFYLRASNGKILMQSSEGHASPRNCKESILVIKNLLKSPGSIEMVEPEFD